MKILYEDKDVLAIDKPAGLMVHGDSRSKEKTLADFILKEYPKLKNVGEPIRVESHKVSKVHKVDAEEKPEENKVESDEILLNPKPYTLDPNPAPRPGIVHRLDRETSGVILVAKNQKSFEHLKKQFQDHTIKKVYQAFTYGWISRDEGKIDAPIGRSPRDFRMWSATRGARGDLREAVTEYKVLKRGSDLPIEEDVKVSDPHKYTLVELYPRTGRTHQIRVHLKYLNHPVVSDDLYARKRPQAFGFDRVALHARSITFKNLKNEPITVIAPYPKDFKKAFADIGFSA